MRSTQVEAGMPEVWQTFGGAEPCITSTSSSANLSLIRHLQAGTVVGVGSGVVTVALPGGGLIRARGSAAIGQKVFVRDDVIEGGTQPDAGNHRNLKTHLPDHPEPALRHASGGFRISETCNDRTRTTTRRPVENMLLLRREDFDELPTVPPNAVPSVALPISGWRTAVPRRTSANCAICWKRGAMPAERRGRPPSRS